MTVTIGRRELLAALSGATVIGRRRRGRIAEGRKLQCAT
jgi:hypothetical protein